MKSFSISYLENRKFYEIVIYGSQNLATFLDENLPFIKILSIEEV